MKKILAAVITVAWGVSASFAATEEQSPLAGLEIGTRILHVELQEDSRGTGTDTREDNFLGSIDYLDAKQDYAPLRLYAQYFFSEYVGAGISYDTIEADASDEFASDGVVGIDGPILYLVGRYRNESPYTPFLELGVAFYRASFSEAESWADDGDNRRYMEVDDTQAVVLGIGCDCRITDQWSVNIYARMVDGATIDAAHFNSESPSSPRQSGEFVLDYFGLGLGAKYAF